MNESNTNASLKTVKAKINRAGENYRHTLAERCHGGNKLNRRNEVIRKHSLDIVTKERNKAGKHEKRKDLLQVVRGERY